MFNSDARWTGDYVAAGMSELLLDFDNRSGNGNAANVRVALNGGGGWFASDDIVVADGSGWILRSISRAKRHIAPLIGSLRHFSGDKPVVQPFEAIYNGPSRYSAFANE